MSSPIARVNPLEDDEVDRAEVEVQQCMELTVTNRTRARFQESVADVLCKRF